MRTFLPNEAAEMICPRLYNESGEGLTCRELQCMAWQPWSPPYEAVRTPAGARPAAGTHGLGWAKRGTRDGLTTWSRAVGDQFRRGFCGDFTTDRAFTTAPPAAPRILTPDECAQERQSE